MALTVKVLDKGDKGSKGKKGSEPRVLHRYGVDANEMVASDPERFEIVDDETPHDEDLQGNPVKQAKSPPKFVKNPEAGTSGAIENE